MKPVDRYAVPVDPVAQHVPNQASNRQTPEQEAEHVRPLPVAVGDGRRERLDRRDQDRERDASEEHDAEQGVGQRAANRAHEPDTLVLVRHRAARQGPHRPRHDQVRGGVDGKAPARPERRDDPTPQKGPDEPREVVGDRALADGLLGQLLGDAVGADPRRRRGGERPEHAARQHQQVDGHLGVCIQP